MFEMHYLLASAPAMIAYVKALPARRLLERLGRKRSVCRHPARRGAAHHVGRAS
jgi:hypothetical protein